MIATKKKAEHGILVEGLVTVRQGKKVIARARNHWVDQGLRGLISQIIWSLWNNASSSLTYAYPWYNSWKMYLGSDTATPTTTTMTALTAPIGTAPGTSPNSQSASVKDGSTDGIWSVTYLATWNAGTVSGTVGEIALYLRALDNAAFQWQASGNLQPSVVMASRLSSADLDFSSFVIDTTKPLTVEWKVQFSFI
jgi:hypothetical protein